MEDPVFKLSKIVSCAKCGENKYSCDCWALELMQTKMRIVIPGPPIPKARPKFHAAGKYQKAYDPQNALKQQVALLVKPQISGFFSITTALCVKMTLHIAAPKILRSSERKRHSWGLLNHTSKPDLDNLIKFYLDMLNGIAFEDDRQIVELHVKKIYSKVEQTVIDIMPARPADDELEEFLERFSLDNFLDFSKEIQWIAACLEDAAEEDDCELHKDLAKKAMLALKKFSKDYRYFYEYFQKAKPEKFDV